MVTEKAIYGITIDNTKLAKNFLKKAANVLGEMEIQLMNGEVQPKDGQSFSDAQWQQILDVQAGYEAETGEKSGVTFTRTDTDNSKSDE